MNKSRNLVECCISSNLIPKAQSLRFVKSPDSRIILDLEWKLQGEYICFDADIEILKKAANERIFEKKFDIEFTFENMLDNIITYYKRKILDYIAIANKAGNLVVGKRLTEKFLLNLDISKNNHYLIIQASDSSTRERFSHKYSDKIMEIYSSDEISAKCGKDNINFMLVYGKFADIICELYRNYKKFNIENER